MSYDTDEIVMRFEKFYLAYLYEFWRFNKNLSVIKGKIEIAEILLYIGIK